MNYDHGYPKDAIVDFHGENYWLDNMWLVPVQWSADLMFNSTEQGFVYFKTIDPVDRGRILGIGDPYNAKAYGRNMRMRPDWDEIKYGIMYELVKKKFDQHHDLRIKLLATGSVALIEGNSWHDDTWGNCECPGCRSNTGANFLGKTLMSLRAQYQEFA